MDGNECFARAKRPFLLADVQAFASWNLCAPDGLHHEKTMLLEDMFANTGRHSWRAFPLAWLQSPGFAMLAVWRLAARLAKGGPVSRVMAAMIWRHFVANRGCNISLAATIGARCRLPHPIGIVIGDGARVGDDVTIYQNVTLGRLRGAETAYPVVENGVEIYSGAVVAGDITIGQRSVIGANSVVLASIPPDSTAVGAPARLLGAVGAVHKLQGPGKGPRGLIELQAGPGFGDDAITRHQELVAGGQGVKG